MGPGEDPAPNDGASAVAEGRQTLPLRGGVHGGVAAQVAPRDEGLAAGATPELFAVGVDAHVHLEGARLGEALATEHAAVAALARVDALVALQVAGVGEALPAQRAGERLLARVHPHVGVEVLQGGQSFTAAGAHERPGGSAPPAAAPRTRGHAHSGARRRRVAWLLPQRILGSDRIRVRGVLH